MKDIDSIIDKIGAVQRQIKDLESVKADLIDELGDLPPDDYVAGRWTLKVYPTRKFDPATAEANLTDEELASIIKPVPNSTLAKRVLSPERYAQTQRTYGMTRQVVENA